MDPALAAAVVAAAAAIVGSLFTLRASREAERTKTKALDNTNQIEAVRLQMEGWKGLTDNLRADNEVCHDENARLREMVGRLQAELADCQRDARSRPRKA